MIRLKILISKNNLIIINLKIIQSILFKDISQLSRYLLLIISTPQILIEHNNPKIIRIFDLIEDNQNYYVVSELIMGDSAMSLLRAHGYPFTEI